MESTQINEIIETAVANLGKIAEANSIIGKPLVTMDGTTILPISQITFGFLAGGGEYGNNSKVVVSKDSFLSNFAGGSGGGASVTPIGFLVVGKDGVKMIDAEKQDFVGKILEVVKDFASKN